MMVTLMSGSAQPSTNRRKLGYLESQAPKPYQGGKAHGQNMIPLFGHVQATDWQNPVLSQYVVGRCFTARL